MSRFELPGLQANHPVGFLAACGLLRCLSDREDIGEVKLGWKVKDRLTFAFIETQHPVDVDSLAEVLRCRGAELEKSPAVTWSTKINDKEKYRICAAKCLEELFERGSRQDVDMLAALASDMVVDKSGFLRSTGFDLTSGNQQILSNIVGLASSAVLTDDSVREALIGPWKYEDEHHSLGWDPQVQRLHALRGKAPRDDKENRSVAAAVSLASQALPLFPCFAVGGKLKTTGFCHHDGDEWFMWPIWRNPISLNSLRSLLGHPVTTDLRKRGVKVVYWSQRAHTGGSQGNYQVFSYSKERPSPDRDGRQLRSPGRRVTK